MDFFDLNDDVKSIIAKHCTSDYFISTMFMSKHQDLQKIFFGEIVFDNDFRKIKNIQDDVKNNNDFYNGKIYKIYKDINEVLYIGSTHVHR
jgi:hypothetical protein